MVCGMLVRSPLPWLQSNDERIWKVCCLQPLQLSQLPRKFAQNCVSTLCPMAMFRIATLFSLVLVGFVVKHADGVRGPSQASMIEREVTSGGKDPCEKFGAKRCVQCGKDVCECPIYPILDRHRMGPTKECNGRSGPFLLSKASPGCRCVTFTELTEALQLPVAASALRFCDALVERSWARSSEIGRDRLGRIFHERRLAQDISRNLPTCPGWHHQQTRSKRGSVGTRSSADFPTWQWWGCGSGSSLWQDGTCQKRCHNFWWEGIVGACPCTSLQGRVRGSLENDEVEGKGPCTWCDSRSHSFCRNVCQACGAASRGWNPRLLRTLVRLQRPHVLALALLFSKGESRVGRWMLWRDECVEELLTRADVQFSALRPLGQRSIPVWPQWASWDRHRQGAHWSEFLVGVDKGRSWTIKAWQRNRSPWTRQGEHGVLARQQRCWWRIPPSWIL